jgi:hypothetical protein
MLNQPERQANISPMRAERDDVNDRPHREREQQMKPHLGSFDHAPASSSSVRKRPGGGGRGYLGTTIW